MKHFIYITIFFTCFLSAKAQTNLVPNPSFEIADTCPTNLGQMNYCHSWSSYCGSPDYFNTCNTGSWAPPNIGSIGYQTPVFGNAYAGFIPFENNIPKNYREVIGAQLISSLNIGTKYYFSFFVSCAGMQSFTLASDKIGLRFSTVPYSVSDSTPINNFANYYETTIITDTVNWVKLNGSFVADSIYKYIALGNFFDDAHTDTVSFGIFNDYAYYFIDNVCLSTDSIFADNNVIKQLNESQKSVMLYPNPCKDKLQVKCTDFPKEFELFDLLGQSKIRITNSLRTLDYVIDTSALDNGIYFLKINFQNRTIQKQIIISK
jgi:hypothetical protein